MILAFDTYYWEDKAKTVCIAFEHWDSTSYTVYTEALSGIAEYTPGEFYKRELPCILSLLRQVDLVAVDYIIVDGFVYLDDNHKPGLGARLYDGLDCKVPVIGVAKTNFATIEQLKKELYRGTSIRPLYITAAGIDLEDALKKIRHMAGNYRIPDLLKKLDTLTKENK